MITGIARAWKLTLAWTISLVSVGALASVLTSAQAQPPRTLGLPTAEIS